ALVADDQREAVRVVVADVDPPLGGLVPLPGAVHVRVGVLELEDVDPAVGLVAVVLEDRLGRVGEVVPAGVCAAFLAAGHALVGLARELVLPAGLRGGDGPHLVEVGGVLAGVALDLAHRGAQGVAIELGHAVGAGVDGLGLAVGHLLPLRDVPALEAGAGDAALGAAVALLAGVEGPVVRGLGRGGGPDAGLRGRGGHALDRALAVAATGEPRQQAGAGPGLGPDAAELAAAMGAGDQLRALGGLLGRGRLPLAGGGAGGRRLGGRREDERAGEREE